MAAPTLPQLLDAAGRELAAMGAVAEGLQAMLTPTQASAGLQALDLLTQQLSALSGLLRGLATEGDARLQAALDAIPLADLSGRLRGLPADAVQPSGELELFGGG